MKTTFAILLTNSRGTFPIYTRQRTPRLAQFAFNRALSRMRAAWLKQNSFRVIGKDHSGYLAAIEAAEKACREKREAAAMREAATRKPSLATRALSAVKRLFRRRNCER